MWTTILIIGGTLAAVAGTFALGWRSGKKSWETRSAKSLQKSAEKVAEHAQELTKEARKTAAAVDAVGPDTLVDVGNKLLSGGR